MTENILRKQADPEFVLSRGGNKLSDAADSRDLTRTIVVVCFRLNSNRSDDGLSRLSSKYIPIGGKVGTSRNGIFLPTSLVIRYECILILKALFKGAYSGAWQNYEYLLSTYLASSKCLIDVISLIIRFRC